jgi:hypothetical protein
MQLTERIMPSQIDWEDSYGNQKGKQEGCEEEHCQEKHE